MADRLQNQEGGQEQWTQTLAWLTVRAAPIPVWLAQALATAAAAGTAAVTVPGAPAAPVSTARQIRAQAEATALTGAAALETAPY